MNKQLLGLIERAVHSDQLFFPLNQGWQLLHETYNIGLTQGNKLKLSRADKEELLALVKASDGIDLENIAIADFKTLYREQVLEHATDEKLAGQPVKKARLAIKVLKGFDLKVNGQAFRLPDFSHLDIALENIESIEHTCILLIENYRCFDQLNRMKLNWPGRYANPLVLFRGDNHYSERDVRLLVERFSLPVWGMADLDPKGLVIVQTFPHIVGLVAPRLSDLDVLFKASANTELYGKQLAVCQNALANSPHPLIRRLWDIMKIHQAGIVQENWLRNGFELILHNLNSTP